MAYRTILLELVDDAQGEARIRCGLQLAGRFEAELVAVHVSLPPFAPSGYGEGAAYVGSDVFEEQREANRLVRESIARGQHMEYVDVFTTMLGRDGRPRPELFVSDSLHMTPAGYTIWRERLRPVVR